MALTKVLITVKTYPSISTKYDELVCTAGFKENGCWVRIYPIQFRKIPYKQQYKKYDWIEIDLVKNTKDFRPESYRPVSFESEIKNIGHVAADGNSWAQRRELVLKNKVHSNLGELISEASNKETCTSLAVFKPTKVIDFIIEEDEREWSKGKLEKLNQCNLFQSTKDSEFKVVKKLPYKFSYLFEDDEGKKSKLMIEDWEVGELYWNCLRTNNGDEAKACRDVKKKFFDEFVFKRDLHFFLGTTQAHHFRSKNPFIIIGVFYPKIETEPKFL